MIVNTNIPALLAMNALDGTQQSTQTVLQQLSTGYRINSAANDPAGLAIATEMNSQVGGLNQAYQNAQSANSLLQTAEGGIGQDQQILQQIRSLAVEASNGTMTTGDRNNIQQEVNQLITQINDNANGTTFNNLQLLTGTFGSGASTATVSSGPATLKVVVGSDTSGVTTNQLVTVSIQSTVVNGATLDVATATVGSSVQTVTITAPGSGSSALFQFVDLTGSSNSNVSFNLTATNISTTATSASFDVQPATQSLQFQIGANANTSTISSNTLDVNLGNMNAQALGLQDASSNNLDVSSSAQSAQNAIQTVDNALTMLTTSRANVGAYENQLTYTMSNLQTESTNLTSAQSNIMDVNMASAMTQFTQDQVLQQSGAAMLAQAQALPDLILKLLS